MSSAKARCSSGLTIALPPNFTTIVSPWNRLSHGRDSMSTCALACAVAPSARHPAPSRSRSRSFVSHPSARVGAVLVHVVVREVVGEDRGGCLAGVQLDRARASRAGSGRPARAARRGARRGTPAPRSSTRRRGTGRTAACVVPIAASTRPQFGSLPKIAALKRLLRATERPTSTASSSRHGAAHLDRDVVARALRVLLQLHARATRHASVTAAVKASSVGHDAGRARRQQGDLVVGRHAAVGVEAVEGDPRRGAQRRVERRRMPRRRRS